MTDTQNKLLNLYPIDYPFETLVSRVEKGKLILNPDFQRKYKWDKDGFVRASRFIESCLMRIPLPACYFAEDEKKNHLVIDGVQRITTIINYFNNEFELEGLTIFTELNGLNFSELDDTLQNDLENYTIRCIVLRNDNKKKLIKDIFARLNQGAVTLTKQEIRHALYPGAFNDLLTELSKIELIKNFGRGKTGTQKKDGLEAQEQVLRFFALNTDLSDYEDNLHDYLDKVMDVKQELKTEDISKLRDTFIKTLDKCVKIFDKDVFVDTTKGKPKESLIYYDLLMWSFMSYSEEKLILNKGKIKKAFIDFCLDEDLKRTTSGGTQNKSKILKRRKIWNNYFQEVIK